MAPDSSPAPGCNKPFMLLSCPNFFKRQKPYQEAREHIPAKGSPQIPRPRSLPHTATTNSCHTRLMYSWEVLDHFQNPRNAGELAGASASAEVSNPVCGDILKLAIRVEQGKVAQARFLCRGCTTAIACASRLTELLSGNPVARLREVTVEELAGSLGGLPEETVHGAHLAIDAARALGKQLPL